MEMMKKGKKSKAIISFDLWDFESFFILTLGVLDLCWLRWYAGELELVNLNKDININK